MYQPLEEFIQNKSIKTGKALDLGAGDYNDVNDMHKLGWFCEGVDLKTNIDLEKIYNSENKPFDIIYSNYVFQLIKNKRNFFTTIHNNLKPKGHLFIHYIYQPEKADQELESIKVSMTDKFECIEIKKLRIFDNDLDHKHWHHIIQITGIKS